jgi:predicted peptidase
MKDIPIWVFHGDADRTVPWESSQVMVDALEACGGDVRFTLVEGAGHHTP